jgi:hypothetical protein
MRGHLPRACNDIPTWEIPSSRSLGIGFLIAVGLCIPRIIIAVSI